MGQVTIAITKRCAFRDSTQEWSNVYTYRSAALNPDNALAITMINEVANAEKVFHSTGVTFIKGRLWSSGGTIAENAMIAEVALTGTGSGIAVANMDKERAYLVMWKAGRDTRGRQVYLRKWYHTGGQLGTTAPNTAVLENTAGFTTAQRAEIVTRVDTITRILSGIWGLTAESGRERDGFNEPPIAHKYLEHHQLGDQWRD